LVVYLRVFVFILIKQALPIVYSLMIAAVHLYFILNNTKLAHLSIQPLVFFCSS